MFHLGGTSQNPRPIPPSEIRRVILDPSSESGAMQLSGARINEGPVSKRGCI